MEQAVRDTSLYYLEGIRLPSVSECLGACGLTDMSGIPKDALEHARLRGEEIHEWTALLDQGHLSPNDEPDTSIEGYVAAYIRFKEENGFEITGVETPLMNHDYRYAGTEDRRGFLRRYENPMQERSIDLKNVAIVSEATRLQTTGYSLCGGRPLLAGSLQLKNDGTFRYKEYGAIADVHDWLAVVRVTHWKIAAGMVVLED